MNFYNFNEVPKKEQELLQACPSLAGALAKILKS
jgi:hypothetical protein